MAATQQTVSTTVPAGYTMLPVLIPDEQVTDYIETFAATGGYNPAVHGSSDAAKTAVAKQSMATNLQNQRVNYRAQVIAATEAASGKKLQVV